MGKNATSIIRLLMFAEKNRPVDELLISIPRESRPAPEADYAVQFRASKSGVGSSARTGRGMG